MSGALGRIVAIIGNVLLVADAAAETFRPGMRIVADDDLLGRTPRAGFATVVGGVIADRDGRWVTVDSVAALNACAADYLFEKPPDAAELLEARIADIERRVQACEPPLRAAPPKDDTLVAAIRAQLRHAIERADSDAIRALADALRAVEGR